MTEKKERSELALNIISIMQKCQIYEHSDICVIKLAQALTLAHMMSVSIDEMLIFIYNMSIRHDAFYCKKIMKITAEQFIRHTLFEYRYSHVRKEEFSAIFLSVLPIVRCNIAEKITKYITQ